MIVKKHASYLDLTPEQIEYYNQLHGDPVQVGSESQQVSPDTIVDIQRAQTHPFLGDGFFNKEELNTNGRLGFKRMLQSMNFNMYTGSTYAEKAISVATVYQSYLDNQTMGNMPQPSDQQQGQSQQQGQQQRQQQVQQQGQQSQQQGQQPTQQSGQQQSVQQSVKNFDPDDQSIKQPGEVKPDTDVSSNQFNKRISHQKFNNISEIVQQVEEKIQFLRENIDAVEMLNPGVKTPEQAAISLTREDMEILRNLSIVKAEGKMRSKKPLRNSTGSRMQSFNEVTKLVNKTNYAKPDFSYKLMHKELNVKKHVRYGSQALLLLIDDSGSMSTRPKQQWVKTMLVHHLIEVKRKNAILYIIPYETRLKKGMVVKKVNEKTLDEVYQWLSFNGGTTDIENCIKQAQDGVINKQVINLKIEGERPQVAILLDGEDHVSFFKPKFPTHAIVLGNTNPGLEEVIKKSNGVYKEFKI